MRAGPLHQYLTHTGTAVGELQVTAARLSRHYLSGERRRAGGEAVLIVHRLADIPGNRHRDGGTGARRKGHDVFMWPGYIRGAGDTDAEGCVAIAVRLRGARGDVEHATAIVRFGERITCRALREGDGLRAIGRDTLSAAKRQRGRSGLALRLRLRRWQHVQFDSHRLLIGHGADSDGEGEVRGIRTLRELADLCLVQGDDLLPTLTHRQLSAHALEVEPGGIGSLRPHNLGREDTRVAAVRDL